MHNFGGERALAMQRPLKHAAVRTTRWVKQHPLVSKAVPTAIGFCFGDILTQYGQRKKGVKWFDPKKTLQMLVVGGAVAGPLGLGILMLPGNTPALIGAKLLADQVVGCVIWQAAYLQISPSYRTAVLSFWKSLQEAADGQQVVLKQRLQACMPA